jgi:RHS repeat-associated protein
MKNSRMIKVIGLVILVSLLGIIGFGQPTNKNTENSPDKNLKGSSRINPSTLAMEFTLPIGGSPGRAGNSVPISLSYSSKVWNQKSLPPMEVTTNGVYNNSFVVHTSYNSIAKFSKRSISGWTSSMQVPAIFKDIELYNQDGVYFPFYEPPDEGSFQNIINCASPTCVPYIGSNASCYQGIAVYQSCRCGGSEASEGEISEEYECLFSAPGSNPNCGLPGNPPCPTPTPIIIEPTPTPQSPHIVARLRVSMPDGSSIEFRKNDTPINCTISQSNCSYQEGEYLSVNGSGMRLKVGDTSISGNPEIKNSVLYLPNGARYVFPDLLQPTTGTLFLQSSYLLDVDGNKTTFDTEDGKWADTMGREIEDPLPNPLNLERATVGTKEFTLPGMSNPYKITWSKLRDENDPEKTVFENSNTELHYMGSDTCKNVVTDNPLSPALFSFPNGTLVGSGNPEFSNYQYLYKERYCGAMPSGTDNTPPPIPPVKFNPVVMSKVELPNGKYYEFKYNEYGEITYIKYPTGVIEKFKYVIVTSIGSSGDDKTNRGVVERKVIADGVTQTWTYQISRRPGAPNIVETTITNPDLSKTVSIQEENLNNAPFGFENPLAGIPNESKSFANDGRLVSRTLTEYIAKTPTGSTAKRDARPSRSVTFTFDPSSQDFALATFSKTEYDDIANTDPKYFAHLNPKKTYSYDYAVVPKDDALDVQNTVAGWNDIEGWFNGKLDKTSETNYLYDPLYQAKGINSLPIKTEVKDKTGNLIAKTETIYDNYTGTPTTPYPFSSPIHSYSGIGASMDCSTNSTPKICWENPNNAYRGHPTTSRVWNNDDNTWIETHAQTDMFGNPIKAVDAIGNEATTEFSSEYKYAYPTKTITPAPDPDNSGHGTNQTSTTQTKYDFMTGLPLEVTDDFGQTIKTEYDAYLRPIRTQGVNVNVSITETSYDDSALTVTVRKQIDETNWEEAINHKDSLGREVKSITKDNQGDIITETKYDIMGRVSKKTNPYRNGEQKLWNLTQYDEIGRVKEMFAPAPEEQIGESIGNTNYSISTIPNFVGTVVTTVDASGKKSRSITNAQEQLIRIDEATNSGGTETADLGTLESPNQPTYYTYSPQGKIVKIQQDNQNRYFLYDYLGRLIRVRQPEQDVNSNLNLADPITGNSEWTAGLTYDILGNVLTATDSKGTVTTTTYDKLSRPITKTYSDGTLQVNLFYDNLPLGKGKLIKVSNSISTSEVINFSQVGKVLSHKQTTNGQSYTTSYKYNLFGTLIETTYPSGRIVKNFLDNDGDLISISSRKNQLNPFKTYASNISYSSHDAINSIQLGNGRWESTQFNSRLQIKQISLGTSSNATDLFKLEYDYGTVNTGNIKGQTITVPTVGNNQGFTAVQTFSYDSLNRLKTATENINNQQTWKQTFNYDRFSNRKFEISNTTTISNCPITVCNPDANQQNNRLIGYGYDANGNVQTDAEGRTFIYDAHNRQIEVRNNQGNWIAKYFYDGDGKRVKKLTPNETTIFVYDANGKSIAEYSTTPPQNQQINYLTTDHLDTPRVITNAQGNVTSRNDYRPFGEEINTTERTQELSYQSSSVKQKYTQKERDDETQLDYFGARYYSATQGRFTTTDPIHLTEKRLFDPQQLNLYAYVRNNPLIFVDPDGKEILMYLDNQPSGLKGKIYIIDSKNQDNVPKTMEVDLYKLTVRDTVTKEISTYYVARDAPMFDGIEEGKKAITTPSIAGPINMQKGTEDKVKIKNLAFNPKEDEPIYLVIWAGELPQGSGLTSFAFRNPDGTDGLDADPINSRFRKDPNKATSITIHVGGIYTNPSTGRTSTAGSEGCMPLNGPNQGVEGLNAFKSDIQKRKEALKKAKQSTNMYVTVKRRTNINWFFKLFRDGRKAK